MNNIHIYQNRHLFQGDDYIGKLNISTRTVSLDPKFEGAAGRVKSFIAARNGMMPRITFGAEAAEVIAPPPSFPPEIVEQMTPLEGHRTPIAIAWAKENLTRAEFLRVYGYELTADELPESKIPQGQGEIKLPSAQPAAPKTAEEKEAEKAARKAAKKLAAAASAQPAAPKTAENVPDGLPNEASRQEPDPSAKEEEKSE